MTYETKHCTNTGIRRGTLVLAVPSKWLLQSLFLDFNIELRLFLGLAVSHPLDQFCRRTGRELAFKRLNWRKARIKTIEARGADKFVFHFQAHLEDVRSSMVYFGVSMARHSAFTKLEYAEIA